MKSGKQLGHGPRIELSILNIFIVSLQCLLYSVEKNMVCVYFDVEPDTN